MATRNGAGTKEAIRELVVVHVDGDFKTTPQEKADKLLAGFPLPPTYRIASGGGYHLYWLLEEPAGKEDLHRIEAINQGAEVLGIQDGFRWLAQGRTDRARPLHVEDVSRIHLRGGSILRTSRTNPTRDPKALTAVVAALGQLGVGALITIGGDDTAFSASRVAAAGGGALRVVH